MLYQQTAPSALYNAEARFPPPLCHPRTRDAILRDLNHWVGAETGRRVCWLHGPAGTGKSAIAQTVAQNWANKGALAASFFFWRADPSRNHPRRLFTTIALQLTSSIPEIRTAIVSILASDPLTLTSSIETQFDALILRPWLKTHVHRELLSLGRGLGKRARSPSPTSSRKRYKVSGKTSISNSLLSASTRALIIDGLDECSDGQNQARIISILVEAVQKYGLPFKILITSRPEPRIKEVFNQLELRNVCFQMPLDDTYQASLDIRLFLQNGFRRILKRHSHLMDHVPRPWPSSSQIEHLVQKASGQFIYPSTVLKYVDDDSAVPADRLNVILGLPTTVDLGDESPLAELDALYRQILSTVRNTTNLLRILAALVVFQEKDNRPLKFIDLLHSIPRGTISAIFSGVHSLFQSPSPVESDFQFCHASFTDFLFDPRRSLHFTVDKAAGHDYLAQCCLKIMIRGYSLLGDESAQATSTVEHYQLEYAGKYWAHHCANASGSDTLSSQLDRFDVYAATTYTVSQQYWWNSAAQSLAHSLVKIFCVWAQLQERSQAQKLPKKLQQFHELSTVGFSLTILIGKGECQIPISLSPDLYYNGGDFGAQRLDDSNNNIISTLEKHLELELDPFIKESYGTNTVLCPYLMSFHIKGISPLKVEDCFRIL